MNPCNYCADTRGLALIAAGLGVALLPAGPHCRSPPPLATLRLCSPPYVQQPAATTLVLRDKAEIESYNSRTVSLLLTRLTSYSTLIRCLESLIYSNLSWSVCPLRYPSSLHNKFKPATCAHKYIRQVDSPASLEFLQYTYLPFRQITLVNVASSVVSTKSFDDSKSFSILASKRTTRLRHVTCLGSKMDTPHIDRLDIQSRFVNALRTQASNKAESRLEGPLPCPYGHNGRMFQTVDQLLDHARTEHSVEVQGLDDKQGRMKVRDSVVRAR